MSLSSPTIVVSAATTLTKDQSGCTVSADTSGAYTITLPSLQPHLSYRFVARAVGALVAVTCGAGNFVRGFVSTSAGAAAQSAVVANGTTHIKVNFTATAVIGDYFDLYCDGTRWYVRGASQAAAGITITT